MEVTHIVRRLGRVGGMESYVWYLCRALALRGVRINLVCEDLIEPVEGIPDSRVLQVAAPSSQRPRWKAMRHFQRQVNDALDQSEFRGIIHSHERTLAHDVTTIHGPLMGHPSRLGFMARLNRRVAEWSLMELQEVCGPTVRSVFSVSKQSQRSLRDMYPDASLYSQIMWPGVDSVHVESPETAVDKTKVIFVGREWKRKGLSEALDIMRGLQLAKPHLEFHCYGVSTSELPKPLRTTRGVTFHGFTNPDYSSCCLLIHPAQDEPFGMVVSEARAFGIPCLVSDRVGAAGLGFRDVAIVSLEQPVEEWIRAGLRLIDSSQCIPEVLWSWDDLAVAHIKAYMDF